MILGDGTQSAQETEEPSPESAGCDDEDDEDEDASMPLRSEMEICVLSDRTLLE